MFGIRAEIERMAKELHDAMQREYERAIFEQIPDHKPNAYQRRIMEHLESVTGFAVIQDKGTSFSLVGPSLAGYKGCFTQARFNPKLPKDCIIMNVESNDPYWYSVLFHELAHATGVPRLLDRKGLAGLEKDLLDYAFEELIAETVAMELMERFGYATDKTRKVSSQYLQNYELHFAMTQGRLGWRPIDRDKLREDADKAKALVLQWVAQFDPSQYEMISERYKEFNKFF